VSRDKEIKRKLKIKRYAEEINSISPDNPYKYAKEEWTERDSRYSFMSVVIPIALAAITYIFSIDLINLKLFIKIIIVVLITISAIVLLLVFKKKCSFYRDVCDYLSDDKDQQKKTIASQKRTIEKLKDERQFYVSFTNRLGKAMANANCSLLDLADLVTSHFYNDLKSELTGLDYTINLYELKNDTVRMIGHQSNEPLYGVPTLYAKREKGVKIDSDEIKNFYCVKCLQDKRNDLFTLGTWIEIFDNFRHDERLDDSYRKDRDLCLSQGFNYNQYIGCRLYRNEYNVTTLLEIITYNDTIISEGPKIIKTARKLFDKYMPLISMLWDLVDEKGRDANERESSARNL